MTLMILRYHCHIKLQGQAVVWCHPTIWWQFQICINFRNLWIIILVLVGDLTIFLPLSLAFFFLLSLFIFFAMFSFCVKRIFSSPRLLGVYGDTWFSLVPLSVFISLVYKFLVEAKFFLSLSRISSCWILRTRWWGTYKNIPIMLLLETALVDEVVKLYSWLASGSSLLFMFRLGFSEA